MKNSILRQIRGAVIPTAVVASLALTGCMAKKATSESQNEIAVDSSNLSSISASIAPLSVDFGEVKQNEENIAPKVFILTNTSNNNSSSSRTISISLNANCRQDLVTLDPNSTSCTLKRGQSCSIYVHANSANLGELNGCKLLVAGSPVAASIYLKVSQNGSGTGTQHLVINSSLSGDVYSSAAIHDVAVSLDDGSGNLVDSASGEVKIDAIDGSAACAASTGALGSSVGGVVNNTGTMTNGLASFGRVAYSLTSRTAKLIRLRAKFQSYVACTDSFNVKPYDDSLKNAFGTNPKIQWKLASANDSQWGLSTAQGKTESNPVRIYQGNGIPSVNLRAVRTAGSLVEVIPAFRDYEFLMVMSIQRKVGTAWSYDKDFYFYKSPANFTDGNRFWAMEFGDYDANGVLSTPSNSYTLKAAYPSSQAGSPAGGSGSSQSGTLPDQNSMMSSILIGTPIPFEICALYRIVFRAVGGSALDNPTNNDVLYIKSCIPTIDYTGGSSQASPVGSMPMN